MTLNAASLSKYLKFDAKINHNIPLEYINKLMFNYAKIKSCFKLNFQ